MIEKEVKVIVLDLYHQTSVLACNEDSSYLEGEITLWKTVIENFQYNVH